MLLWRGYHSKELFETVERAWTRQETLILLPPTLHTGNFVESLPKEELSFLGEWTEPNAKELRVKIEESHDRASWKSSRSFKECQFALFTSGSVSGESRLVLYSKENVESSLVAISSHFKGFDLDRIFCLPQPFHTFGFTLGYLQAYLKGWELDFITGPYKKDNLEIWKERVTSKTLTLGSPAHFFDLVECVRKNSSKIFAQSPTCIIGGAPVTPALWKSIRDELHIAKPSIGYGCTEASPGLSHLAPGVEPIEFGEIGTFLPGVNAKLVDSMGIEFSGPNLCWGLAQDGKIEHPEKLIIRDHLVETEKDSLIFKGRWDWTLNRGGEKFSLTEIEAFLESKIPFRVMAFEVPDNRLGAELGLMMAPRGNRQSSLPRIEIESALLQKYGRRFSARHFYFVSDLPLSPQGKIWRNGAAELLRGKQLVVDPVPVTELQSFLPHRDGAVWIQQIDWVHTDEGQARVFLDERAENRNYLDGDGRIRDSAGVEWIAQAMGFVTALRKRHAPGPTADLKQAYLVGFRNFKFHPVPRLESEVLVRVRTTREFGPVALVQGEVLTKQLQVLCTGEIRLFSSP